MRPLSVFIITVLSLFGIYYINSGKTGLKQTGEVAGREEVINYTLPPSWAFSIWGLIYLGFVIYAVYGLLPSNKNKPEFQATGFLVALSILLNLGWTVTVGLDRWPAAYPLQWFMLLLSVLLLFRWGVHHKDLSLEQKWLSAPFALYMGWLTVAMIPYTSSLLNNSGWNFEPFTQTTWALILYGIAALIILLAQRRLKHPFILLPLVWAYAGFASRFPGILRYSSLSLAFIIMISFFHSSSHYFKREQV